MSTFDTQTDRTQIGPHTFHLHEIYGLSSAPSHPVVPTTPVPTTPEADPHSYPPMTTATTATRQHITEDEPSSECLVCLSSPREVVLLPCRHLVACKECALNMVEFGAGGSIVQPENEVPAAGAGDVEAATGSGAGDGGTPAEGAAGEETASPPDASGSSAPTTTTTATATTTTRRKRKAKGWFCPVCRQRKTADSLIFPN